MTKKRTKKAKLKARASLASRIQRASNSAGGVVYKLGGELKFEEKEQTKVVNESPVDLLAYPPELVKRDMYKTVLLSLLMFGLEIGVYIYLTYVK